MQLTIGNQAPDFSTEDIFGKKITLKNYSGKKLLLCFFRYAGCPYCNLRFSQLLGYHHKFSLRGLKILTFFQSPKESVLSQRPEKTLPFPVIADPEKKIYNKYGVESSVYKSLKSGLSNIGGYFEITKKYPQGKLEGDMFLLPAEFLIGPPRLTLANIQYTDKFSPPLSEEAIEKFIK